MGKITCYDISGVQLTSLYQWDSNRSIVISGVDPCIVTEVHFCNIDSEEALVVSPRVSGNDVTAAIPNILLQKAKPILVYVFSQSESSESRTVESTRIVVIARPKPANYVYYETEVFSYSAIDKRLLDLEESISEMIKSVNGATPDEDGNVDAKPDWGENDETAPGYIKNRPFYDVLAEVENVTSEEQITCGGDVIPSVYTIVCIEERSIYKVIFDSVEYICEANIGGNYKRYIGNGNRFFADIESTSEPFCMVFSQTGPWNGILEIYADDGDHTIQVIRIDSRPVKIDEKFIPNTVARTPDWNQNDSTSPSYIKNRPFYACYESGPGETYVDERTINISGESGSDVIMTNFNVPPALGHQFYIMFDGVDYGCQTVQEVTLPDGNTELGMGNFGLRNPELEDNGLPFYIYCTYWGCYVFFVYAEPGEHTIQIRKDKFEIKKLSEEFIPDTVIRTKDIDKYIPKQTQADWNQTDETAVDYIKNRTHYEEVNSGGLMYEGIIPDSLPQGPGYNYMSLCSVNEELTDGILFIGDNRYDFVTDIEFYTVEGYLIKIVLYNTGNSYDVRFTTYSDTPNIYGKTLRLYKGEVVVHQLDEKFIPDTIARVGHTSWDDLKNKPFGDSFDTVSFDVTTSLDDEHITIKGIDGTTYEFIKLCSSKGIPFEYSMSIANGLASTAKVIDMNRVSNEDCSEYFMFVREGSLASTIGWIGAYKQTTDGMYELYTAEIEGRRYGGKHLSGFLKTIQYKPIDEKYIPSTIARTKDIPKQVQADFEAKQDEKGHILNRPMNRTVNYTNVIENVDVGSYCIYDFRNYPGSNYKNYLTVEGLADATSEISYALTFERMTSRGWSETNFNFYSFKPFDGVNLKQTINTMAARLTEIYCVQDYTLLSDELKEKMPYNGVWIVVTGTAAKDNLRNFTLKQYYHTKLSANYLPKEIVMQKAMESYVDNALANVPKQILLVNVSTTYSDSGEITYSADKTIDEMLEAIQAGIPIVCMYGRQECSLDSYSTNKRYISFVFHIGGRTNSLMCAADEWTLNPTFDAADASMFPIEAKPDQVLAVDTIGPGGIAKLKTIDMPGGGGEKWETIIDYTVPEDCAEVFLKTDINGNPFKLKRAIVTLLLFPAAGLTSEEWPVYTVDGTVDNVYGSNHYRYGAGYIPYETGMYRLTKFEVVQMPDGVHLLTVRETKTPAAYDEDGDVNASLVMAGGGFNERFHAKNLAPVVTEISAVGIGYYMTAIGAGTRIIMQGVRE